jgi:DNA mismatch endonuclease, patch repair protein
MIMKNWKFRMANNLSNSERMAKVKGKNTGPELIVRKFLFSKGFRYRINDSKYPGKPDIVLPKFKTIIFIHGCFWHGHPGCRRSKIPNTNIVFWKEKVRGNIARDSKKILELENAGWKVVIVWECELMTKEKRESRLNLLIDEIRKES